MTKPNINIEPLDSENFSLVIDYFLNVEPKLLEKMGVDINKLGTYESWYQILKENDGKPIKQKDLYFIIWKLNNMPIGHSNINKIEFGKEAFMHVHLWQKDKRQKGLGSSFVRESISHYIEQFELKRIFCEPKSTNTAPNNVLKKVGFKFVKAYETTPGALNSYQEVNRWVLEKN